MNSIRIFLNLLVLLLLISCGTDQGATKTYTLTVKNESGVTIKVKAFNTFSANKNEVLHTTVLKNNEKISKTYEDGLPPRGYYYSDFFGKSNGTSVADSIQVIFNNDKFLSYNVKNNKHDERNPLDLSIYRSVNEFFVFTAEDYENAQDCNGNCE